MIFTSFVKTNYTSVDPKKEIESFSHVSQCCSMVLHGRDADACSMLLLMIMLRLLLMVVPLLMLTVALLMLVANLERQPTAFFQSR